MSKFLHAASFANARKLDVTIPRISCLKLGQSATPTSKTDVIVLTNKRPTAGTIFIRFLIYLKAIYGQKNERNWFFESCYEIKILLDFSRLSLLSSVVVKVDTNAELIPRILSPWARLFYIRVSPPLVS